MQHSTPPTPYAKKSFINVVKNLGLCRRFLRSKNSRINYKEFVEGIIR